MQNPIQPIKTGLCAYGMSGQVFHAPFLHCLKEFTFSAVTERHHKKAKERYPEVKSFASVEEMIQEETLELIIVNTPNVTHFDYAKKALLAGKHVVVEKPFAATTEEAKALIKLAEEKNRLLVAFQNRRWDSDFLVVQKVIQEKKLGKLIEAEFHYDRYRIALNAKKEHKEKAEQGVGLIYDLGPHLIDQAIALFGKPESVFARVQHHRPQSVVDDYFDIHLLYPHFNCTLKASLLVKEGVPAYVLQGTEGSFLKSRSDIQEKLLQKGESPCTPDWGKEPEDQQGIWAHGEGERMRLASPEGNYSGFFEAVYQSIRNGQSTPIPLSESLLNMEIIEAAFMSEKESRVVQL